MGKADFFRRLLGTTPRPAGTPSPSDLRRTRRVATLCRALMSERGEVSGAAHAKEALQAYAELDGPSLEAFFDQLVAEFSPDPDDVARLADEYRANPTQSNLIALNAVAEAPRQELFRRLNMAPGATAVLVEMRRRLLEGMRGRRHPEWAGIDHDLSHLLRSWFNRGFLQLARIDWRTSAIVLEKLIKYEAVHAINGWTDLHRRLEADRRCYAFFHPALPDEPLIFIEVALTRGMAASVQPLLDPASPIQDPAGADCAIFYSITNCQEGLRGVSFGNLLIKQVAEDLGREFPRLKTFATLSPIPGFRRWLAAEAKKDGANAAGLAAVAAEVDAPAWHTDPRAAAALQPELLRLCADYLIQARDGAEPLDPVARFHLGNGARMERLNWLGDTSAAGMQRSAGLMVNYVYKLAEVERNHEAYAREHRVIASTKLEVLARESARLAKSGRRRGTAGEGAKA